MCILGLNTAVEPYSYSFIEDGSVLESVSLAVTYETSENIMFDVQERLHKISKTWADISAIYVIEGPGSYTGLRIGLSFAKSIAMVFGIPLYGVSALAVLSSQVLYSEGLAMSVIKARKGEFNIQLFSFVDQKISNVSAMISFSEQELLKILKGFSTKIYIVGQVKFLAEQIQSTSLVFLEKHLDGESVARYGVAHILRQDGDYRKIMPQYSHYPILR